MNNTVWTFGRVQSGSVKVWQMWGYFSRTWSNMTRAAQGGNVSVEKVAPPTARVTSPPRCIKPGAERPVRQEPASISARTLEGYIYPKLLFQWAPSPSVSSASLADWVELVLLNIGTSGPLKGRKWRSDRGSLSGGLLLGAELTLLASLW